MLRNLVLPGLALDFALSAILPLHPLNHPERSRGISGLFHPGAGVAASPSTLSAKSSRVGFIFSITTPRPPTYLRRREGLEESTIPALQPLLIPL